nr:hypothetical protein GCM10020241_00900 [Streptoalloteichus tenebrarius]
MRFRKKRSLVDTRRLMPNLRVLHLATPEEVAAWEARMAPLRRRRVRVVLPAPPLALLALRTPAARTPSRTRPGPSPVVEAQPMGWMIGLIVVTAAIWACVLLPPLLDRAGRVFRRVRRDLRRWNHERKNRRNQP